MNSNDVIIQQTKSWVERVVIGCNFCPFAGKAFVNNSIHFEVASSRSLQDTLEKILIELQRLDQDSSLETTLVIFPNQYSNFEEYLDVVSLAEGLLTAHGYEGIYQIASFHPEYLFAQSEESDPANYTNRSPYPTIHLLRESSVSKAVDLHPNVEDIPNINVAFAREKGLKAMKDLKDGKG